ncbi:MAG: DUF4373 domain-containing protein [Anaerostipes sp.]|nr:DUF4373 domain-containing protein [Anaerostipes sp.]
MKIGLEYFSLDCVMDDKIRLVEAKYGIKGFALVVKLYQKIYGGCGYYCEFNDDIILLFASDNRVNRNLVSDLTKECISRGIFDSELYSKYRILTSKGIQKRYLRGCERRKKVKMENAYLLLSEPELPDNVYISDKNGYINGKNAYISKQSKVEESRVKESKVVEEDKLTAEYGKECVEYYKARVTDYYGYLNQSKIIQFITQDKKNQKGFFEKPRGKNKFHNFDQRDYDFDDIERICVNNMNRR